MLQFLINKLRIRGQIGVYGRSIGGIAAAHLVNKFPKIIKVFIGDRTMGDLDSLVQNRYNKGKKCMLNLYKLFSCHWRANNVDG